MTSLLLACDRPRFAGAEFELGQFDAQGPVLCLVGAWSLLFRLLAGKQRLVGGSVSVCGQSADGAVRSGHVGLLLADSPLPATWKLSELLCHSGALLGLSRRAAAERGREAARELGLSRHLSTQFGRLSPAERRITGLALALLGEPALLALEEPFGGLEPTAQSEVGRALALALRGRRALVSVAELPGSIEQDGFVQTSSELLFANERGLVARASYAALSASASHYRLVVLRHAEALCEKLRDLGYAVQPERAAGGLGVLLSEGRARGTRPLLEAALSVDAPIVELRPVTLKPGAAAGAGAGV